MSFPPGTEMFQFPGFASTPYVFRCRYPHGWVSPFGNPRINDRSHLPAAYRSVPRPSSPLGAKASTERSYRAQYIPPMPARRTKPHDTFTSHSNDYDRNQRPLPQHKPSGGTRPNQPSFTHSLFCSRHRHTTQSFRPAQHSQSRDQPIRFTCQTSRHPDQTPQGLHQAANLLCRSTQPSKEHRSGAQPTRP
jgi:hypothetical protein